MSDFSELDSVKSFLAQFENPLLLVLIGTVLTAVIQSSSVMTSMAITMVVTGLISLNQGIYITMGANIGTCVTALIAGITSTKNAKRTALIHLIFNISGVVVFLLIGLFMNIGGIDYGFLFNKMFPNAPQIQLSMFHTIFNILTVIIVLPLTNLLVKLVAKIIPDKKDNRQNVKEPSFRFFEEHMLRTPPIAVQQIKNEIIEMANTAISNFDMACKVICDLNYENIETFRLREKQLNFLQSELAQVVGKLLKEDLAERDRLYLTTALRTIIDLERVGDYAENIIEYADVLKDTNTKFSEQAIKEINDLKKLIMTLYEKVMTSYKDNDKDAFKNACEVEEKIDVFTEQMAQNHIRRLESGKCTAEVEAQYISLSANAERIADHFINVAKTINSYK